MSSLSVKLPLTRNAADGFTMIKDFNTLVKQNLKMLILTSPGERVMEPQFGAGIKRFLFENFNSDAPAEMSSAIRRQVKKYMPEVTVINIGFDTSAIDSNRLGVRLEYAVVNIGVTDLLEFTI